MSNLVSVSLSMAGELEEDDLSDPSQPRLSFDSNVILNIIPLDYPQERINFPLIM